MSDDLDEMQRELNMIANLTQGAEEKISYMRDSATSAQKSSQPGNTMKPFSKWIKKYDVVALFISSHFLF